MIFIVNLHLVPPLPSSMVGGWVNTDDVSAARLDSDSTFQLDAADARIAFGVNAAFKGRGPGLRITTRSFEIGLQVQWFCINQWLHFVHKRARNPPPVVPFSVRSKTKWSQLG